MNIRYSPDPLEKEYAAEQKIRIHQEHKNDFCSEVSGSKLIYCCIPPCINLTDNEPRIWAYDGDNIVGVIHYVYEDEDTFPYIFLRTVAVLPNYRRKGIGSTLLTMLKELAKRPIMICNTTEDGDNRFAKCGFKKLMERNQIEYVWKWSPTPEYDNAVIPDKCNR